MDPGQLLDNGSEFISQGFQFFGKVIGDIGRETATAIHDVADTSEAALTAVTYTSHHFTKGVANGFRDAGRALGIEPISEVATNIFEGCGHTTVDAVNMGFALPVWAAKETANFISFGAETGSNSVTAIGWGFSAARTWKTGIRDTGTWLHRAYDTMKKLSLLDALVLAIVMVILLLGMCTMVGTEERLILILGAMLISYFPTIATISIVVAVSTIIALVEARLYLAQLPAMRSRQKYWRPHKPVEGTRTGAGGWRGRKGGEGSGWQDSSGLQSDLFSAGALSSAGGWRG
jgi:hypothetical protein